MSPGRGNAYHPGPPRQPGQVVLIYARQPGGQPRGPSRPLGGLAKARRAPLLQTSAGKPAPHPGDPRSVVRAPTSQYLGGRISVMTRTGRPHHPHQPARPQTRFSTSVAARDLKPVRPTPGRSSARRVFHPIRRVFLRQREATYREVSGRKTFVPCPDCGVARRHTIATSFPPRRPSGVPVPVTCQADISRRTARSTFCVFRGTS